MEVLLVSLLAGVAIPSAAFPTMSTVENDQGRLVFVLVIVLSSAVLMVARGISAVRALRIPEDIKGDLRGE